ncbi:rosmarinate synthase-like [Salvia miltiorrhiza]|uniref:rosmarinate synthase-like n=1 Tax=Salvia miltiorrhiza TaxID=226208 RepID=UPI0025AB89DC|nr:rosmarinate synthase-like [Salvia miltiorrhiza]
MKINVKESTMVKPASETPSGSLWLSNLDIQIPGYYHSRSVYLYRSNDAANFFDAGLLKAALGRALVDFYPYAGRLDKADDGRLQINCNSEGALFVEAECDAAVDDLGDFAARAPDLPLAPKVDYSGEVSTWPLLLLQLTRFKCGSISLGVTADHHVADGTSGLHFVNTWADMARGVTAPAVPPVIDRRALSARQPPQPKFPHDEYQPPPQLITPLPNTETSHAVLKLTPDHLRAIKESCGGYSTYQAVTGHVWRCVCAARGLPADQPTRLKFSVNGRPRLQPPLPPGLFGNVNFYTTSTALCGELVSNPVGFAAGKVQAAVDQMNDEYLRSVIDYLEVKMPSILNTPARSENFVRCPNFDITSWVRLPFYEGDFGWGKPAYAGPAVAHYEGKSFLMLDPESQGSWLLQITLLKPHMDAFHKLFYDIPPSTKNITN